MANEAEAPQHSAPTDDKAVSRLVSVMETAYHRPWYMMWRSFLSGLMAALGASVGAALFFTILIWVFQALGGIELLRPGLDNVKDLVVPTKYLDKLEETPAP